MSITIEMLDSFPGSYMPETKWLLYAENAPAPLCRKPGGSYMAEDDTSHTNIRIGSKLTANRFCPRQRMSNTHVGLQ